MQGSGAARAVPITIDVEASGFGRGSYPIEIGIAFADGQEVSYLIRPARGWIHWDPEAERIHGISRMMLQDEGQSAVEVAALLNGSLAGSRVFSDAWSFDASWVARLFDAAGFSQHFRIDTVRSILTEEEIAVWQQARREMETEGGAQSHRAGDDARLLQLTVLRARQLAAGI